MTDTLVFLDMYVDFVNVVCLVFVALLLLFGFVCLVLVCFGAFWGVFLLTFVLVSLKKLYLCMTSASRGTSMNFLSALNVHYQFLVFSS